MKSNIIHSRPFIIYVKNDFVSINFLNCSGYIFQCTVQIKITKKKKKFQNEHKMMMKKKSVKLSQKFGIDFKIENKNVRAS